MYPSSLPNIDLQVLPTFPANVVATGAVDISKSGLTYTFGLNFQNVSEETNVSDMSKREVLVQDTDTGAFWRVKLSNIGAVKRDGDVMTGPLTVINDLVSQAATNNNNTHVWLRNADGKNRGLVYWDRNTGAVHLRVYVDDGNGNDIVAGNIALRAGGTMDFNGNTVWHSGNLDPWAVQPIGVPIPVFTDIPGVSVPPRDTSYRYVNLAAGVSGSGQYNEGILTNETVTGSAPLINATAVINLPASPMHGQTIRLINTERRFIRAGSSGATQDDAFQGHWHTLVYAANGNTGGAADNTGGTGSTRSNRVTTAITDGVNGTPRVANETRPKNIGANYFMRIL